MSNMEAATVAKLFVEQLISRFGNPNQIHSDLGRQFNSKLFAVMCDFLHIDKARTTHITLSLMAWLRGLIKLYVQ